MITPTMGAGCCTARRDCPDGKEGSDPHRCHHDGCKRPHRSQGYCAGHYVDAKRQGWPIPHPAYARALRRWREEHGQLSLFHDGGLDR